MNPYYQDDFGTLFCGNSLEILPTLEPNSINMVMTSPPYWKARKYDNDNELGQEADFNLYINNLCKIFDFVKIPLLNEGSLFVNIGDKYFSKSNGTGGKNSRQHLTNPNSFFESTKVIPLMPQGSLIDIPNRFAIQMVDDWLWILKHRIIWHKPNAFPTSNKKKFTLDYEFIYHFVLNAQEYYFEQQFEPSTQATQEQYRNILRKDIYNLKEPYKENAPRVSKYKHDQVRITSQESPNRVWEDKESLERQLKNGRNKRSVWDISIGKERGSSNHIAMYPIDLCITPILACSSTGGTVLDPFMGSGTTAIAAERLKRKWIGIEFKEEYAEESIIRILKERKKRNV